MKKVFGVAKRIAEVRCWWWGLRPFRAAGKADREPLMDLLVEVIREERRRRGVTLGELAEEAGMSYRAVLYFLRGKDRPSCEMVARLAWALGMWPSQVWAEGERRLLRQNPCHEGVQDAALGRPRAGVFRSHP